MSEIRARHWAAFRRDEWARIVAVDTITEGVRSPRKCYLVAWADGTTDLWPVVDPMADYEFRETA